MKNVLSIIMFIFITGMVTAQTAKDWEPYRVKFAQSMVSFVNTLKPVYVRGESYESFKKKAAPVTMTAGADKVLNKAYTYLTSGASDDYILVNYNGKEIAQLTLAYAQSSRTVSFEEFSLGSDYVNDLVQAFSWKKFWGGFKEVAEWVLDNAEKIWNVGHLFGLW